MKATDEIRGCIPASGAADCEFGLLAYDTRNIGDDIQSLAARQYLPGDVKMVNRDLLAITGSERPIKLIMNAWFMGRPSWPPASCIQPFFISFHIGTYSYAEYGGTNPRDWMLGARGIEYLKAHQPIGCRDLETLELLEQHGIACYFSGCLTLTLAAPEDATERREILLVDPHVRQDSLLCTVPQRLRADVHDITHATHLGYAPDVRLQIGAALLRRYAQARLVITSRLHCLLPCLAFGTPVLFVPPPNETGRLRGYEGFYNVLPTAHGEPRSLIPWEHPEPNPDRHVGLARSMRDKVEKFVAGTPRLHACHAA